MTNCPSCKYSVSSDALKCPNCGAALAATSAQTAFMPPEKDQPKARNGEKPPIHTTESADGARFAAGTMLAERYRIISLPDASSNVPTTAFADGLTSAGATMGTVEVLDSKEFDKAFSSLSIS